MILIKNAEIIDGTGRPPFKADVLIKDDKISAIGNFVSQKADLVIDALGSQLTPGFIDVNTDSDHYLSIFTEPRQRDFLLQGVTTIFGGQCGSSLAPLLYGTLESIRKWTDPNQINVGWHTVAEFLRVLERQGLGVNFGTLIGHSTIRRALIGETLRDLTVGELEVFKQLVGDGLEEGAFGLSTGLGYAHARQVPYAEIRLLAEIVAKHNGVYATHLRNEKEGLLSSIAETLRLGKEAGVKTIVSHLRPLIGYENDFVAGLEALEHDGGKLDIHFDSYPFDTSLVAIYTLLPDWAKNGGLEIMLTNVKTPFLRTRLLKELPVARANDVIIVQAPRADYLVGKTLGQFASNQDLGLKEGLLKLMIITNMRAVILYKNVNMDLAIQSLGREQALVASNGPSLVETASAVKHERLLNTFPKFLEIATSTKMMPIEAAIKKLTSTPAQKFNLADRGVIKEEKIADLVLMKNSKISHVFVNGKLAVKDGSLENILAGKVLRRAE